MPDWLDRNLEESEILIRYGRRDPDRPDEILAQYDQLSSSTVIRYMIFEFFPDLFAAACFLYFFNICQFWAFQFGTRVHLAVIFIQLALMFATITAFAVLTSLYVKSFKLSYLFLPSDLGISATGLRLYKRNLHIGKQGRLIPWDQITNIQIDQACLDQSSQFLEPVLSFSFAGNSKPLRLRLSMITSIEERRILHDLLKQSARRALGGNDISGLIRMTNPSDIAFTQLWSQALMDGRARLHTNLLPAGTILQAGRFVIEENIGGGGQGAVYLAQMQESGEVTQEVILKEYILPDKEHFADYKKAVEQFENEIRLMSKVRGVRIARLIDAFVEDRRSYLVLEKIEGVSLRQVVDNNGPFDNVRALSVAKQMCEILLQLHTMSPPVMHLDFSPENLILSATGEIVLIDFNISSEEDAVRTKTVMGKQHYMAPEQYRGSPVLASDIYAWGATMFFLLTGKDPEPISVSRPSVVVPAADKQLDQLIADATVLDERERIANVELILCRLLEVQINEPVSA
jgi:tRNA A-37 threonylcarbamoyl transferase component Bud32